MQTSQQFWADWYEHITPEAKPQYDANVDESIAAEKYAKNRETRELIRAARNSTNLS